MNQPEASPSNNADAGRGLSEGLGPLPEPWRAGDLKPDTQVYTADACWFYAARAVAAERERLAAVCWERRGHFASDWAARAFAELVRAGRA